ncbi:MAG: hypothetical protein EA379_09645 [Phycisphaerales bacterium]|nr:MAG: hypothetical protein EA379_09645 [Phycisphaerales bacterium]
MTLRHAMTLGAALTLAGAAGATTVTTFGDSLNAGVVIGSGISNTNFVVNTNTSNGVQTGIKAFERFVGDISSNMGTYYAQPGESPVSGAAGAPADPGTATWNYLYSVDLGAMTFAEVAVNVAIDFNPAAGNSDVFEFELVSTLAAQNVDISSLSLFQDSQNLGFGFWQSIGDPNIYPFNPFAPGEYTMSVDVVRLSDSAHLSGVNMTVVVVPLPTPIGLAAAGLLAIPAIRRRRV